MDSDMLTLSSIADIKKYALRVFATLFIAEEMADGIVELSRANSGKTTCDQLKWRVQKYKLYNFNMLKFILGSRN